MTVAVLTDRLVLRPMSPAFLTASQLDDLVSAEAEIGLQIPADWLAEKPLMAMRLADMADDPAYAPWSVRAIGLRSTRRMVGHIGFHERPRQQTAELGYSIFPAFRRQGFAHEAIQAMLSWALLQGARRFRLSVSPDNAASQALARKLGFTKIGTQVDPVDGIEDVLELTEGPSP